MKRLTHYFLLLLLLPLLTACPGHVEPNFYSEYEPVLMSRAQLENSVAIKEPQPLVNPGKLYRYGHYILINEQYKGVHIINNQNPESPEHVAFIQVPGNVDIAVKSNVLYADNAVDLVAINLNDMQNIQVTQRIRNTFPKLSPPDKLQVRYDNAGLPEDAVIVGWELKDAE